MRFKMGIDENEEVSFRVYEYMWVVVNAVVVFDFSRCFSFHWCLSTFNRLEVNACFNYKLKRMHLSMCNAHACALDSSLQLVHRQTHNKLKIDEIANKPTKTTCIHFHSHLLHRIHWIDRWSWCKITFHVLKLKHTVQCIGEFTPTQNIGNYFQLTVNYRQFEELVC